uniref:Ancillary SecYEG translocon subunit/Cell division coordinator CpoB TPR domain-containing protein n=1 Tax=uncultured Elusimicrobia bacterium TaxID=699876 RepID=A0A650EM80_9BACT|nr:hypothetical protein Elusimicrob1349_1860 [uncultured Elusimicrobia bacterium]
MTKKTIVAETENTDLVASFLTGVIQFCKKNKRGVLAALIILALAAATGSFYAAHQKKVAEESWAAYYAAQTALLTQGEAAGFKHIDDLAKKYPGTNAAQYALLLKGDTLYANENFAQAADVYKELANAKNETVHTVAALSRAAALQAAQDYKGSAEVISVFIEKHPKHFALAQAYMTLAASQELAGNKEAALEAYKHLLEAYTKTYFGVYAKDKITELQK